MIPSVLLRHSKYMCDIFLFLDALLLYNGSEVVSTWITVTQKLSSTFFGGYFIAIFHSNKHLPFINNRSILQK